MEKINEQTLKAAADRLHLAWSALAQFTCFGLDFDCDDCPLQYEGRCASLILCEMQTLAVKRAQEAAK